MRILNLYAGLGGNRKLWQGHEVTAVEYDEATAHVYSEHFPDDTMIIADAHQYLLDHYGEYDFIWASPPCPSHSDIRRCGVHAGKYATAKAIYPDMSLYQEIILLQNFAPKETLFVVENVITYYKPLIAPQKFGRHYFWTNFLITNCSVETSIITAKLEQKQKR